MFLTFSRCCKFAKMAPPLRCNRIAVTVQSHRRYGAIASPLRCNRDAVTVQSRCRYGEIAMRLQCNGDAIWLLWQQKLAENAPKALPRGASEPFFRSKSTCFQVLNFGNNILQFIAVSPFPALSFDCHSGCGWLCRGDSLKKQFE